MVPSMDCDILVFAKKEMRVKCRRLCGFAIASWLREHTNHVWTFRHLTGVVCQSQITKQFVFKS